VPRRRPRADPPRSVTWRSVSVLVIVRLPRQAVPRPHCRGCADPPRKSHCSLRPQVGAPRNSRYAPPCRCCSSRGRKGRNHSPHAARAAPSPALRTRSKLPRRRAVRRVPKLASPLGGTSSSRRLSAGSPIVRRTATHAHRAHSTQCCTRHARARHPRHTRATSRAHARPRRRRPHPGRGRGRVTPDPASPSATVPPNHRPFPTFTQPSHPTIQGARGALTRPPPHAAWRAGW